MKWTATARSSQLGGFALSAVLVAVAALLLLAIGMLAFTRLERKSARAYSDGFRAELAVEFALADVKSRLARLNPDEALIVRTDTPILLEGRPAPLAWGAIFETGADAPGWIAIPLASGFPIENFGETLPPLGIPSPDDRVTVVEPEPSDRDLARARWVEVPASRPGLKLRYAYWVEDLAGRLDGALVGSLPRQDGEDPREIGLHALFDPEADGADEGPEDELVAAASALRTPGSVHLVLEKHDAELAESLLAYGLPTRPPSRDRVPFGFGYRDEGKPKFPLNPAVAAGDVDGIAAWISANLPRFHKRAGAFPPDQDYVRTLAASLVDYADADSDATLGPNYRGVDSYPFVNAIYDHYIWLDQPAYPHIHIQVRTFVELWNVSDRPIRGTVRLTNENRHRISIPGRGEQEFGPVTFAPQEIEMEPNEFRVLEFSPAAGPKVYEFEALLPLSDFREREGEDGKPYLLFASEWTLESRFRLEWNGREVDRSRGGMTRTDGNLYQGKYKRRWKGHAVVHLQKSKRLREHPLMPGKIAMGGQWGDPRQTYYIGTPMPPNTYSERSSWGGRAVLKGVADTPYGQVNLAEWPDGGHDSEPGVRCTDSKLPTEVELPQTQPKMAPTHISNAGKLRSVAELGHLYDPAQWLDVEGFRDGNNAHHSAGGGMTLAIGRPEFPVFDEEGFRAAQLLDLFAVDALPAPHGRVNVNTAPREVLQTLMADVVLAADPQVGTISPPKRLAVGDLFAAAVIATRNRAPLRGLSDFARIRVDPVNPARPLAGPDDGVPFFGNPALWPEAERPPAGWDDAGREELFAKVAGLVRFGSETFRIHVAGQLVAEPAPGEIEILASHRRTVDLRVDFPRDEAGDISGPPTFSVFYEKVR